MLSISPAAIASPTAATAPTTQAAHHSTGERITLKLRKWGIPDEAAVMIISMSFAAHCRSLSTYSI